MTAKSNSNTDNGSTDNNGGSDNGNTGTTEILSATVVAGKTLNIATQTSQDLTADYITIKGGTATLYNGKTATAEQAEEIHAYIRSCVAEVYGEEVANDTTILYGGSCKASNAPELFSKPDIDGGLIGGASLKAADFKGIIDAWN